VFAGVEKSFPGIRANLNENKKRVANDVSFVIVSSLMPRLFECWRGDKLKSYTVVVHGVVKN
jgi:capsid protein